MLGVVGYAAWMVLCGVNWAIGGTPGFRLAGAWIIGWIIAFAATYHAFAERRLVQHPVITALLSPVIAEGLYKTLSIPFSQLHAPGWVVLAVGFPSWFVAYFLVHRFLNGRLIAMAITALIALVGAMALMISVGMCDCIYQPHPVIATLEAVFL